MSLKNIAVPAICAAAVVAGCAQTNSSSNAPVQGAPAHLIGHTFQWTSGITEAEGEYPHIAFDQTGNVSGLAGCNSLLGEVHQKGLAVDFSNLGTTRMLCAPKVMKSERAFLELLKRAAYATQSKDTEGAVDLWSEAGDRIGQLLPKND